MLKPNVLMFKEDGKYYVSVKNFSSFLNYTKLKSKLNQIPESEEAIIDFSMCDFVDDSVMENLNNYAESFTRKGGHFEVIGLDDSKSVSDHPFALRKIIPKQISPINQINKVLTKRQKSIEKISQEMHWKYDAFSIQEMEELPTFGYFKTKKIKKVSNVLSNEDCTIFDAQFSEGEMIAKQVVKATMLHIHSKQDIPFFTLDKGIATESSPLYFVIGINS